MQTNRPSSTSVIHIWLLVSAVFLLLSKVIVANDYFGFPHPMPANASKALTLSIICTLTIFPSLAIALNQTRFSKWFIELDNTNPTSLQLLGIILMFVSIFVTYGYSICQFFAPGFLPEIPSLQMLIGFMLIYPAGLYLVNKPTNPLT